VALKRIKELQVGEAGCRDHQKPSPEQAPLPSPTQGKYTEHWDESFGGGHRGILIRGFEEAKKKERTTPLQGNLAPGE